MSYTRKLLIVAPYGVGLRDVLFNVDLSDYIRENYSVDVITPLSFKDPSEMGIQNVYWHKNSTLIERLLCMFYHFCGLKEDRCFEADSLENLVIYPPNPYRVRPWRFNA